MVMVGDGRPLVSAAIRLTLVLGCGERGWRGFDRVGQDDKKRAFHEGIYRFFTRVACTYYTRYHAMMVLFA